MTEQQTLEEYLNGLSKEVLIEEYKALVSDWKALVTSAAQLASRHQDAVDMFLAEALDHEAVVTKALNLGVFRRSAYLRTELDYSRRMLADNLAELGLTREQAESRLVGRGLMDAVMSSLSQFLTAEPEVGG